MKYEISYGKHAIPFYRELGAPLMVPAIPESTFAGRRNVVLGGTATVDVFGDNFLPAYTEGDNSMVVATDTMKNFVHAQALEYGGATAEGFAGFLARRFAQTYPQMRRVRVRIDQAEFAELSDRLVSWDDGSDHGWASATWGPDGLEDFEAGRSGMRLVKLTGSAFAAFQRDRYTTLPEVRDRPLHVFLDTAWRYGDPSGVAAGEVIQLVPSEQVRDLCAAVFDHFVSLSIQHLVHEIGLRLLERFQQLSEVSFTGQNRTWDTVAGQLGELRVFADPRPAHGNITLRLTRG